MLVVEERFFTKYGKYRFTYMASLLCQLNQQSAWREFLAYKLEKAHFSEGEEAALTEFVELEKYERVAVDILDGKPLSIPQKKLINKIGGKKRAVYSFREDENWVLKLVAFLLYRYDERQSPGCFSFRKGFGVQKAVRKFVSVPGISKLWSYKLDIKNYFNSISIPILLPIVEAVIDDDPELCRFFRQMLSGDEAVFDGETIREKRGVMAGTPTSPFFANVYLREVDSYFVERGILYARYSDDIILFAESEERLAEYRAVLHGFLEKYDLEVNPDKERVSAPGEAWEYLGVEYQDGKVDLSPATIQKLKGKIKRKARALYRWKLRKNVGDEQTMKVMIRVFNRKFFENRDPHDLTWSRWFFPMVTEADGFREVDAYLQQYIRYISTGRHGKLNYKVSYDKLKELGYRSLVNEFYRFRSQSLK